MSIYAIWGAPQSGKTTLALNLSYGISRGDKTVCLISPVEYSELSALLGVKIPEEQSLRAALKGRAGIRQTMFRVDELFYVLAMPVSADAFDSDYSDEQIKRLLDLARLTFDFVLVDCPSQPDNLIAAWSLNKADQVLLCVGGPVFCVMWHRANRKALRAVRDKTVCVGSEVTQALDSANLYKLLGCTPEIRIPYVKETALLQSEGRFLFGQSGRKGRAYSKAISQLYGVMQS